VKRICLKKTGVDPYERKDESFLIAPCGLSCAHCPAYLVKENLELKEQIFAMLSKSNPAMAENLTKLGIDNVHCEGCRRKNSRRKNNPDIANASDLSDSVADIELCATYACSIERGVDFCYECSDFPCVKLQPCVDSAELPQNLKVFNLCSLQREGPAEWLKNLCRNYVFVSLWHIRVWRRTWND